MNNEGLTALVKLIKTKNDRAIEDVDNERLQIRIDNLSKEVFEEA